MGSVARHLRISSDVSVSRAAVTVAFSGMLIGAATFALEPSDGTDVQRDVRRFYEETGQRTVWIDSRGRASDTARDAIAKLEAAVDEGLDPAEYRARDLDSQATALREAEVPLPSDITAFDGRLTESLLLYFRHLHLGRVDPHAVGFNLDHGGEPHDFVELLKAAVSEASLDRTVAALRPEFGQYDGLRHALAQYRVRGDPRARQIELAMERLRWIPHAGIERLVMVNIPTFDVRIWDAADPRGHPALEMAAIVGRTQTKTPVFAAAISSIVFNPFWNVPDSILRNEILPAIERDPAYLQKHHMEMTRGGGATRVRQLPGPWNALGRIKFELPNPHDVYLHGTPEPGLFKKPRRDFSHGCVRVEDPVALAEWLLSGEDNWSRDRIMAAIQRGTTSVVPLARPVRVVVFYLTAVFVASDRSVRFADDVYGHDARLDALLRVRAGESQ
jgi:murein L,D-transpeptidase YcbB/YkuD